MAGVSDASPLTPARRRAQELVASGDLAGARDLLEKAVELGQANLAEDDPDVLLTACHLGRVYQRLDDFASARRVLEEAYAAGQWRLGDHDPLMVEISHDIGVVAEELGNRHEARKAFTRVAEYGPAALGANHEAVGRAQAYLGHAPDSVRPVAPPTAAPAAPGFFEPNLTLITPVPSVDPFPEHATSPGLVEPPPASAPVWTPAPRRSPEGVDEATIAQPTITPRGDAAWPAPAVPPEERAPAPEQRAPSPEQRAPAPEQRAPVPETDAPRFGQRFGRTDPGAGPGAPQLPVQRVPEQQPWPNGPGTLPEGNGARPVHGAPPPGGPIVVSGAVVDGDRAYRKKGVSIFAAIAAALASIIAVAALVFVLANRGDDNSNATASDVPTLAGAPPTDVQLRDRGAEIEITWKDPTSGTVSFMVVMAHPGEELKPLATLGPGKTSYRGGGLSTRLNYCFAVVAVYRANQFATSAESCTSRSSADPASSTGK